MISKIPARAPIYLSALLALAFMLGAGGSAQAKFNLSQVGPDYGCLMNSLSNENTQLMQLHTDKKGKVVSGSLSFNHSLNLFTFPGEVCKFTLASGTYTIDKTTGTGFLTLTWAFSSSSDGDDASCTEPITGASLSTGFTEKLAFVLESSGKQLDVAMLDPGLVAAAFTGTDPGDFFKFGSCTKQ